MKKNEIILDLVIKHYNQVETIAYLQQQISAVQASKEELVAELGEYKSELDISTQYIRKIERQLEELRDETELDRQVKQAEVKPDELVDILEASIEARKAKTTAPKVKHMTTTRKRKQLLATSSAQYAAGVGGTRTLRMGA